MEHDNPSPSWRDIAIAASTEKDPQRLLELIQQLNKAIDIKLDRLHPVRAAA
jgi:hypothetical protein